MSQRSRTIGGRYLLHDKLGQGGMGVVYRATDRLTQEIVALKRVTVPAHRLQFQSRALMGHSDDFRLALAQEFKTLASLRHPHIISVLDYGFDKSRQPYLTMELLEDAPTLIRFGQIQPRPRQIELLVQMLQALAYLHRRGIIHRDLKPENVLVVEDQVKVLDFGLALVREHRHEASGEVVGTPAYMAPEVFDGRPATVAADLYAVGMMAYELFAGRHPFNITNMAMLMMDVLRTVPDTRSLGLNDDLVQILDRLLAKRPEARFSSARDLIEACAQATHRSDLLAESRAIRESFLQAAQFVGREAELGQLVAALKAMLTGQGSAWLVGGESGVGKSRLLDELRIQALVDGALVLQGQAISAGAAPYQIWREVVRRLCLEGDLTDLEASVLKALVPDIGLLLNRTILDAPALDPKATYERLLTVIEDVFGRQTRPIVVILEDVHWSSQRSLAILKQIGHRADHSSFLLLASYRDDERPDLPEILGAMRRLSLPRFNAAGIAALGESMLGTAGRQSEVVDLLQQETEGNAFFIVEVVRALAEKAGQLDQVGRMSLPPKVYAEGVQAVIKHRLQQVPEQARPLLKVAATAGRQLDLNILQAVEANVNVAIWLNQCAEASVLELRDDRWHFAHDKLREGLLVDIPPAEQRQLHRQVAEGIECAYPDFDEVAMALAYHWSEVGDVFKAADYTALAGEQALKNGALEEAIHLLTEALTLDDTLGRAATALQRASWERQLGEAYYDLGQLMASRTPLERAATLLGRPLPTTRLRLAASLSGQVILQVLHRLWPARFIARNQEVPTSLELVLIYKQLAQLYYHNNEQALTIHALLCYLNLAETGGASPELATAYVGACVSLALIPLPSLAESYAKRALAAGRQLNRPADLVWMFETIVLYRCGRGQWDSAQTLVRDVIQLAEQVGDVQRREECLSLLALTHHFKGEFASSIQVWRRVFESSERRGNHRVQTWGLCGEVENGLPAGQLSTEQALKLMKQAQSLLTGKFDSADAIRVYGLLARLYWCQGDLESARHAADLGLRTIMQSQPTTFFSFSGYAGVAQVYLAWWQTGSDHSSAAGELPAKAAGYACKALHKFARVFPFAQPRAWLYQGRYDWLAGKAGKARKAWQKSLTSARQLATLYEAGLAHYEIGCHVATASDPARLEHLNRAAELFAQLEAVYDLARVEEELKK